MKRNFVKLVTMILVASSLVLGACGNDEEDDSSKSNTKKHRVESEEDDYEEDESDDIDDAEDAEEMDTEATVESGSDYDEEYEDEAMESADDDAEETKEELAEESTEEVREEIIEEIPDFSNVQVGEMVEFGTFDNETIQWDVLANDGESVVLISHYILTKRPYQENYAEVDWENCDVRAWLNGEFYEASFNESEKSIIKTVVNENPRYFEEATIPGVNTDDKVYLLGVEDIKKYYEYSGAVTGYAFYETARAKYKNQSYSSAWYVRSPGKGNKFVFQIGDNGILYPNNLVGESGGIRPVITIQL